MKKILITLSLFVFYAHLAIAQSSKETADNLILTQTDSDFLACLEFRQDKGLEVFNSSKEGITTFVYFLKPKSDDAVYYRLGGFVSCLIVLDFDVNGEIVEPPPFYELMKIKSIYTLPTIEKSSAIKTALPFFEKKRIRMVSCFLIYDLNNQGIYWEVTSKSGYKNVTEQTVVINALTNEYIRTNEFKYAKR